MKNQNQLVRENVENKLRYPVGKDVITWLEKKGTMMDEQFMEYMKNSMTSLAPGQR